MILYYFGPFCSEVKRSVQRWRKRNSCARRPCRRPGSETNSREPASFVIAFGFGVWALLISATKSGPLTPLFPARTKYTMIFTTIPQNERRLLLTPGILEILTFGGPYNR